MRGTADDGPRKADYCPPRYEWSSELCGCRPTYFCPVLCLPPLEPHPLTCGECISPEELAAFLEAAQEQCSPPDAYKEILCHDGSVARCLLDDPLCRDRSPLYCAHVETKLISCPGIDIDLECLATDPECEDGSAKFCPQVTPTRTISCPSGATLECPEDDGACFDDSPVYCKEIPLPGAPILITCADGSQVECSSGTRDCHDDSPAYCPEEPILILPPLTLPAGPGELCEGFDEFTGGPYPDCAPGLICVDQGGFSIGGGAGKRCEEPLVGGETTIACPDGSTVTCNAGTRDCFDLSPALCP